MNLNSRPIHHVQANKVMLLRFAICFALSLILFNRPAAAQAKKCSQRTIYRLERESAGFRDWSKLHNFYLQYKRCNIDDVDADEGWSESVARILTDHWETLPVGWNLFKNDPTFETWVLGGINITDSEEDLKHIDKLAEEHCPTNLSALCQEIRQSVRDNN